MLRDVFKNHHIGFNKEFRFRGQEPGRLENFSDAVFALAITLLLISTSPPTNFEQIKRFVWDLIPFSLCIMIIVMIWHQHFVFFYRYGLRNPRIIVLNTIFLVIVLFYVYPLKFLTRGVLLPIASLFNNDALLKEMQQVFRGSNMADLMIIYGVGAAAVFLVLAFMYRYALRYASELELNEIEQFDTRVSMNINLIMASVPALSTLVAIVFRSYWFAGLASGLTYYLYPILTRIYHRRTRRKRNQLLEVLNASEVQIIQSGNIEVIH